MRLAWLDRKKEGPSPILIEFYETLALLKLGYRQLDFSEPDFIDWIIFNIGALERRLVALLKTARREGVTAWKPPPAP
ncbi:hypothetical protein [Thermodesulfitimonas autotrophica]|uniref:hypothetical protein n=1 Tax=Thermodesulfitimonas autotrophica TaxID=1894989 RepID=UPI002FE05A82